MKTENKRGTYKKYCPNVYVAAMSEQCEAGEIITLETSHGKENEHVVHNYLGQSGGLYLYSTTRLDGYNLQERAKRKAEQYENWANSAEQKSNAYHEASNEGRDFLVLAEPIKIGHHSEKRHRALIERNWSRMEKSVEYADKAEQHEYKARQWEKRTEDINLSMPESLEYFKDQYEKAKEYHQLLKEKPELREHAYSLAYAKKKVNETKKNYDTAVILWG